MKKQFVALLLICINLSILNAATLKITSNNFFTSHKGILPAVYIHYHDEIKNHKEYICQIIQNKKEIEILIPNEYPVHIQMKVTGERTRHFQLYLEPETDLTIHINEMSSKIKTLQNFTDVTTLSGDLAELNTYYSYYNTSTQDHFGYTDVFNIDYKVKKAHKKNLKEFVLNYSDSLLVAQMNYVKNEFPPNEKLQLPSCRHHQLQHWTNDLR